MSKKLFENVCEEQIFTQIYNSFSKQLNDILYYRYGNQINTEDKVQEAFIKLWQNCIKIAVDDAKGFLFVTSKNLCLNEFKHKKVVLNYATKADPALNIFTPHYFKEIDPKILAYKKALESLSEAQREAFMLNKIEGKKHKEIAELLGISQKAVEKRIYTAFKKIKKNINR